jgi:hypothetical protein
MPDIRTEAEEHTIIDIIQKRAEAISDQYDLPVVEVTAREEDGALEHTFRFESPGGFRDQQGAGAASIRE